MLGGRVLLAEEGDPVGAHLLSLANPGHLADEKVGVHLQRPAGQDLPKLAPRNLLAERGCWSPSP